MGNKKRNPNSIIFNFSINGVTVLSKDDFGDWSIFKSADEHYEEDPKDILLTKEKKQEEKLKGIAESVNGNSIVQGINEAIQKAVDNR